MGFHANDKERKPGGPPQPRARSMDEKPSSLDFWRLPDGEPIARTMEFRHDEDEVADGIEVRWAERFLALKGVWEQRGEVIKALDAELSGYKRREREADRQAAAREDAGRAELDFNKREVWRLAGIVDEQSEKIAHLEKEGVRLTDVIAGLREVERQNEALKDHVASGAASERKLEKDLSQARWGAALARDELRAVRQERDDALAAQDERLAGANREIERLTQIVDEQAATIVQLEQDVFRADADAARWREEHRDVELKLHRCRTESDRAGREDELAAAVELLEKDLIEAKAEIAKLEKDYIQALEQDVFRANADAAAAADRRVVELRDEVERLEKDYIQAKEQIVRVSRELNEEKRKNERLVDENNRVRAKIYGVDPKTEPKEGWAAAWLGGAGATFTEITKGERVTITPVPTGEPVYHEQG